MSTEEPWHLRQTVETPEERNERSREANRQRTLATLYTLIADLSPLLANDRRPDWGFDGSDKLRQRVANALPPSDCPDWLTKYRDPQVISSGLNLP